MENMLRVCYEGTQLASKNMKPVEHFVRRLSNEDHVELMKHIKPCAVKLDVLQATQNFKTRCLIHDRYRCRCINRNKRKVKCLFSCSGCSVQNEQIKDKEKLFRCKTTKINTSQSKQKNKVKSLNCVNQEFCKDSCRPNKNVCVYSTSNIIQEISSDTSSRPLYPHNFNRDKILKPEKCCPTSCDKLAGVFIDVGNDHEGIDYLLEEDNDSFEVSCETLFADNKDIDYNLVKNVKIERYVEDTSRANEINVQNLDAAVFNSFEMYTNGDWPGWSTNANVENMHDNFDSYDNVTNVCSGYITASIVGSGSGTFREVNVKEEEEEVNVKEEEEEVNVIEDVLIHESTENKISRFKVEMVNNEEVSIINESVYKIKLNAVNKMEEQPEISTNNSWFLDKIGRTELIVSDTISSDFQENCSECSDELLANSNINNAIVTKQLKGPFKCETCSKEFVLWSHYEEHRKTHVEDKPHQCPNCPASFNVATNLLLHSVTHNVNDLECPECHKVFSRAAGFRAHIGLHKREESLFCTECGDECSNQIQLDKHMKLHEEEWVKPNKVSRVYKCQQCVKQYSRASLLYEHRKDHYKIKATLSAKVYKRAVRRGLTMHTCDTCLKCFPKQSQLMRHRLIHTGEKPFKCDVCPSAFNQKGSLMTHISAKHNGMRPFECTSCHAAFSQKGNLRTHMLKLHAVPHVDETVYRCSNCSCVFHEIGSLNKHMKRHQRVNEMIVVQMY